MAFLDSFSKKIIDVSQATIQKTKDMTDIAKYNSLVTEEEKKISGVYEQIGKRYVEQFCEAPEENLKEYIDAIKTSEEKIAEYQKNLKNLRGVLKCPTCGAEVPDGSSFCTSCGTKMIASGSVNQEEVHCAECGAAIPVGSKFCTSCGKPVAV